jgi:hypothetical protein
MWPDIEALPVHDDAYDVFMALPPHTSSREDDMQPVVEEAHISWHTLAAETSLLEELWSIQ